MSHQNIILSKDVGQALGLQFGQLSTVYAAKVVLEHDRLTRMLNDAIRQIGPSTNIRSNGKLRGLILLGEERLCEIAQFIQQHRNQYGLELDSDRIDNIVAAAERLDAAVRQAKMASDSNPWEQKRQQSQGRCVRSPEASGGNGMQPCQTFLSPPLFASPPAAKPANGTRPRGFLCDPLEDYGRLSMAYNGSHLDEMPRQQAQSPQPTARALPFDDVPRGGGGIAMDFTESVAHPNGKKVANAGEPEAGRTRGPPAALRARLEARKQRQPTPDKHVTQTTKQATKQEPPISKQENVFGTQKNSTMKASTIGQLTTEEEMFRVLLHAEARRQLLDILSRALHDVYIWQRRVSNTAKGITERPGRLTVTPSPSEYSMWSFVIVAPILILLAALIFLPLYSIVRHVAFYSSPN